MVGRSEEEKREIREATRPFRETLADNPEWRDYAKCRIDGKDVNFFFPGDDAQSRSTVNEIKDYCDGCHVQEECLANALLMNEKFGWWGGKSRPQRDDIRRENNLPPFPVRDCSMCGGMFYPKNVKQMVCSEECQENRRTLKWHRETKDTDWLETFRKRGESGKRVGPKKAGAA